MSFLSLLPPLMEFFSCIIILFFARILSFLLIIKEKTMSSDILTVEEVAVYLKLAKKTVYKMAVEGTIPAFRVGKFWRFKKTEIEEWIKNNRKAKAE